MAGVARGDVAGTWNVPGATLFLRGAATRGKAMPLEIVTVPCLSDNYAYLLRDGASGRGRARGCAGGGADRGGAGRAGLEARPDPDHAPPRRPHRRRWMRCGGYGAQVAGAAADRHAAAARSTWSSATGTRWRWARAWREVLRGARAYGRARRLLFRRGGALFSADSLMVMGCGRLFEGTPEQMWESSRRWRRCPTTRWSIPGTSTPKATSASRCRSTRRMWR